MSNENHLTSESDERSSIMRGTKRSTVRGSTVDRPVGVQRRLKSNLNLSSRVLTGDGMRDVVCSIDEHHVHSREHMKQGFRLLFKVLLLIEFRLWRNMCSTYVSVRGERERACRRAVFSLRARARRTLPFGRGQRRSRRSHQQETVA